MTIHHVFRWFSYLCECNQSIAGGDDTPECKAFRNQPEDALRVVRIYTKPRGVAGRARSASSADFEKACHSGSIVASRNNSVNTRHN